MTHVIMIASLQPQQAPESQQTQPAPLAAILAVSGICRTLHVRICFLR
jgi:hypothetical protein